MAEEMKEKPTPAEKRDWVGEAVQCFIKDATDIDPTDPVKAVKAYFEKNATDELKARCKAEGKDAKSCWKFIEAVARKALNGHNGHIDPAVVYAIAMHYFEDVPVDWDGPTGNVAHTPKVQQGFFFDMLEMQPDEPKPCGSSSPQGSPVAPAEETAVEPSSEAGVSSTESEV